MKNRRIICYFKFVHEYRNEWQRISLHQFHIALIQNIGQFDISLVIPATINFSACFKVNICLCVCIMLWKGIFFASNVSLVWFNVAKIMQDLTVNTIRKWHINYDLPKIIYPNFNNYLSYLQLKYWEQSSLTSRFFKIK